MSEESESRAVYERFRRVFGNGQARSSEEGFKAGGSANRLIPSLQTAVVDQWRHV